MPDVTLNLKLAVAAGPTWNIAHTLPVEAYDVVDLVLPGNTASRVVELQPAVAARVTLLVIQSSYYGSEVTFRTRSGVDTSAPVSLLGPQIYGAGSATLFSVVPNALVLANTRPAAADGSNNVRIQILVGRDATP